MVSALQEVFQTKSLEGPSGGTLETGGDDGGHSSGQLEGVMPVKIADGIQAFGHVDSVTCETDGGERPIEMTAQARGMHDNSSCAAEEVANDNHTADENDQPEWTLVLLCTEPNSILANRNPFPKSTRIIEITKEDDFTSESGSQKLRLALRNPKTIVMVSLPCTGGSPWQTANRRHPACRRMIRKHKLLFLRLFSRLQEVAEDAMYEGGLPMVFEWPRHCTYWKLPEVEKFLRDNDLRRASFDGCHFGLRSIVKGSEDLFLNKPWSFATNITEVFDGFDGKLCPGKGPKHRHDTTCGINARHSQGYTNEMVDLLYRCLRDHVVNSSWWTGWSDDAPMATSGGPFVGK